MVQQAHQLAPMQLLFHHQHRQLRHPHARHDCADISQVDPRRYPRTDILLAAQALLAQGTDALDAVTEAVRLLEECPLFNAGRGAAPSSTPCR